MVNAGAIVEVVTDTTADKSTGYGIVRFRAGERARVTRTATNKVLVSKPGRGMGSAWFDPTLLRIVEDGAPTAPRAPVRKIGEMPAEGEHIAVDDPRIAWIWEDAAKVANNAGHCGAYDDLADRIGAPGRPRDFQITAEVGGLSAVFTLTGRSKKEAAAALTAKIAEAKIIANHDTGRRR